MKFKINEQGAFDTKLCDLLIDQVGITKDGRIYMIGYNRKHLWCLNDKGMSYSDGAPEYIYVKVLHKGSKIEIEV